MDTTMDRFRILLLAGDQGVVITACNAIYFNSSYLAYDDFQALTLAASVAVFQMSKCMNV